MDLIKEIRQFAKPTFIKIFSFFILIGMIFFGVVVIKNINKEFELRQVASRFEHFKYSILSFNNVYSGLPGDLQNAQFYWKDETKNGNGDKKIEFNNGEAILAWQHLQLAKLLEEVQTKMTGEWAGNELYKLSAKDNSPSASFQNSIFYLNYNSELELNVINLAKESTSAGIPTEAVITPEKAYLLDLMIDDGFPKTGNLVAAAKDPNDCNLAGEYKAESDVNECILTLKLQIF